MDARLKKILGNVFDVPEEEIQDGTGPENVGMWTSLNHLRMITAIEKEFGIRLPQKEIREMRSFAAIRETVGRHLPPEAGG